MSLQTQPTALEAAAAAMRAAVFGEQLPASSPTPAPAAPTSQKTPTSEPGPKTAVPPGALGVSGGPVVAGEPVVAREPVATGEPGATGETSLSGEPQLSAEPNQQAELSDFLEAAGLLRYDPAAITRIYAGHPQRLLRRLWQTLVPIGLYLLAVAMDWLFGQLKKPSQVTARAKEAADLVASLGPAFIKAGQALSTRPDIVPPLLLAELAQLQDQLPGFDPELAMACIEEDLGKAVAEIY